MCNFLIGYEYRKCNECNVSVKILNFIQQERVPKETFTKMTE